jgi:hypothetical protein
LGGQPTYNYEQPTDYCELGDERVHASNHPPAAAAAAAAKGLPLSKKRMMPLQMKTEGDSAPKLALSSDTDGSTIRLSYVTLNEAGTCTSVSLRSNKFPSKEDMVARLGAKLEAQWSAFCQVYIRELTSKEHKKKKEWLQDTKRKFRAHVMDRRGFERMTRRPL